MSKIDSSEDGRVGRARADKDTAERAGISREQLEQP